MVVPKVKVSITTLASLETIQSYPHLRNLRFHRGDENGVGLLIGQNNAHLLDPIETVKGGMLDPYAVGTPLGWILYGSITEDYARGDVPIPPPLGGESGWNPDQFADVNAIGLVGDLAELGTDSVEVDPGYICSCCSCDDVCLSGALNEMGRLEDVPDKKFSLKKEDQIVLELWEREMEIIDGHIVLPIPFISDPPDLLNNFPSAYRALMHLGRHLLKHEQERIQYRDAIYGYFDLKIAEIVKDPNPALTKFVWYLLHHGVDHPRKPGKTRVVKHGGAEYKGKSINKATYKGPDLMNNLAEVLTRFRQYKVAYTSDIEGMFNQVYTPERHWDYSRFLFWEDGDPRKPIIVCRLKTHIFGTGWAPAAANFALKKAAELFSQNVETRESIDKDFYVDDLLSSQPSSAGAIHRLTEVREAVSKGGFNMVKIASNNRDVILNFPARLRAKELAKIDISADTLPPGVMLGQLWLPESDQFTFCATLEPRPYTRRGMTSCISSIFDPLGLISPFILPGKLLLQASCKASPGWDEELEESMAEQWKHWIEELPEIENFRLKRWFGCTKDSKQFIHMFSDASEMAYGAASYLAVKRERDCSATLITSKSKIAPKNRLTIPKMEMAGAVLAARLMGNRVAYIREVTDVNQWGHVPGKLNPADLASRGEHMAILNNSALWREGPDFLKEDPESWERQKLSVIQPVNVEDHCKRERQIFHCEVFSAVHQEVKVTKEDMVVASQCVKPKPVFREPSQSETAVLDIITKSKSSWTDSVRLAVIYVRFAKWWYTKTKTGIKGTTWVPITAEEFTREETNIFSWIQLTSITASETKEAPWVKLVPFYDDVWRVGGRLQHSGLTYDQKHPILLPRTGAVTDVIIREAHTSCGHGGVERTLMQIKGRFWIIGGKPTIKRVIDPCVVCKRLRAGAQSQLMAPLPSERCEIGNPPFWNTGVDLFGPFQVIVKRSRVKRYGAIFTCLNTRAVHLEPIEDLTTSAFLDTLERFCIRKCKPNKLRSDNGTNFVGAESEIARAEGLFKDERLLKDLTNRRISWSFNSPAASHQGGVWERLIRSTRQIIVVLLKDRPVTDARLHTVLTMAEGILNSRPLTRLTNQIEDLEPLTPGHFVGGARISPVLRDGYSAERLRQDWRLSQGLATELWHQWMTCYLPLLQGRNKWLVEKENVKVGELVLVVQDQYSRFEWPLGRVMQTHPGKDGLVRNVTVKTAKGSLVRPVQKLVRLELDNPIT